MQEKDLTKNSEEKIEARESSDDLETTIDEKEQQRNRLKNVNYF